jgi:hypothetical protein
MLSNRPFLDKDLKSLCVISIISLLILSAVIIYPVTAQTNESSRESEAKFTEETNDFVVDLNENELFDYLIIEVTISILVPGEYELGSKLILGDRHPVVFVYRQFETENEFIKLQLKFDGEHIYSSGISGNYLCSLWINNATGESIDEMDYKTKEYFYEEFEHTPPPVQLNGRFKELGIDKNEDGFFEYLSISLGVDAIEHGRFILIAGLFKKQERKEDEVNKEEGIFHFLITSAWLSFELEVGTHDVNLKFNGPKIRMSNLDGPYLVGVWLERLEDQESKERQPIPEEDEQFRKWLNQRLRWPMVGEGDLSGEQIFETKEYFASDFQELPKMISFTKRVEEHAKDLDDNGLYDIFVLNIGVNAMESGEYLISGKIVTKDDWWTPFAENLTFIRKGEHNVKLIFKGIEIYKSELTGNFEIILIITGKHPEGFLITDKLRYQTEKKYSFKDFESSFKKEQPIEFDEELRPYAKLDLEGITTKTKVMEVYTTRTRPELTFWFADSEDSEARFRLKYNRLIGYKDLNKNNRFDFGEALFITDLEKSLWTVNDIEYSSNSEYGTYVEFQLSSDISFQNVERLNVNDKTGSTNDNQQPDQTRQEQERQENPDGQVGEKDAPAEYEGERINRPEYTDNWATITFKFLVTSNTFSKKEPLEYEINGDTELKIDIEIIFHKHLDIDGISLEQVLFDEAKSFGFKTIEEDGDSVYLPEDNGQESEMKLFNIKSGTVKQWVMFIDEEEKEYGFYSWVPKINVTYFDGTSEVIGISTTYVTDGTILRLYTNYPYSREHSMINHDPSLGMVKSSKPSGRSETVNGIEEILFNPLIYISACVIALILIFLLRGGQMKQQRHSLKKQPQRNKSQETQETQQPHPPQPPRHPQPFKDRYDRRK